MGAVKELAEENRADGCQEIAQALGSAGQVGGIFSIFGTQAEGCHDEADAAAGRKGTADDGQQQHGDGIRQEKDGRAKGIAQADKGAQCRLVFHFARKDRHDKGGGDAQHHKGGNEQARCGGIDAFCLNNACHPGSEAIKHQGLHAHIEGDPPGEGAAVDMAAAGRTAFIGDLDVFIGQADQEGRHRKKQPHGKGRFPAESQRNGHADAAGYAGANGEEGAVKPCHQAHFFREIYLNNGRREHVANGDANAHHGCADIQAHAAAEIAEDDAGDEDKKAHQQHMAGTEFFTKGAHERRNSRKGQKGNGGQHACAAAGKAKVFLDKANHGANTGEGCSQVAGYQNDSDGKERQFFLFCHGFSS